MSNAGYSLKFSVQAIESLRLISERSSHLLPVIESKMAQLTDGPTALSQPSMEPFPEGYQRYRFGVGSATECVPLFHFAGDEQTLEVDRIVIWNR